MTERNGILTMRVGLLVRRQFRTMLMLRQNILKWQESKGVIESDFVIEGPESVLRMIQKLSDTD